ncbi:MAG: TRAP transporter substrate-binding protein [Magnetovibrio sp.]|nr:TRAP transporter substrate-binding protein [Magnetovibrio sp.]
MRNLIVGVVVGVVVGIVVGTTVIAPRLKLPAQEARLKWDRDAEGAARVQRSLPATARLEAAARPAPPPAEPEPAAAPEAPAEADDAPPLRWRMASAYASTIPQLGGLAKRLESTVWHISGGDIGITFYEPGTLVAASEMFDAVRSGAIDAAFATPMTWADKNPAFQLFAAVPFGPPVQEYLAWMFVGGGREISETLHHAQGVHPIVCGALAPEGSGWFRKPVKTLAEFKALRIGMNGLGGKVAKALGATVMEMAESDVFVALESNLIDGAEASQPAVDLTLGLHQLAGHYYFPSWHQPATLLTLIVNLEAWQALSANQRAQIDAACGDNVRHGLADGEARQFGALKELIKLGTEIETWAPDILDALEAAWRRVSDAEAQRNPDFQRAWTSLRTFREEYGIWREIGEGTPLRR